jgi:hypothetical protein
MSTTTETQTETQTETPTPTINVTVPLEFILNVRNIISTTTARGAFKAEELKQVGTIYEFTTEIVTKAKTAIDEANEKKDNETKEV